MPHRGIALALIAAVAVAALAAWAGGKGDPARGKDHYARLCVVCHGPEGRGDGPGAKFLPVKLSDFTDRKYMRELKDQYLHDIIAKGGSQLGRSAAMPAWSTQLKQQDIRDVIAYIRSLSRKDP